MQRLVGSIHMTILWNKSQVLVGLLQKTPDNGSSLSLPRYATMHERCKIEDTEKARKISTYINTPTQTQQLVCTKRTLQRRRPPVRLFDT